MARYPKVHIIYIHISLSCPPDHLIFSCLSSTPDPFLFPFIFSIKDPCLQSTPDPSLPLSSSSCLPVVCSEVISFSLSLCRSMCAFLHVSVWRTRMTQWCWNERSRAWAFLSKRTIKPYAVHNELTLIQLRCTSCPSVFSLFQFPSVL